MSVHDFWTPFSLEPFLNALVIGITLAGIWLVAALGLVIIYGTMRVINMAHGEFIMLGAYSTLVLQSDIGLPWLLCLPVSFFVVAAIGWVVEKFVIRHLYSRPLDTLVATFGLSLIFIQGIRIIFGGSPQYVEIPSALKGVMQIDFIYVPWLRIFILAAAVVILVGTWMVLNRSTTGIKIRAVMQNPETAAAFGVNAKAIYSLTFAFGCGLAGLAGAMFSGLKTVFPDMGLGYVIEAFLVVVTGGGELMGSLVTATIMGQLSSIFSYFTNDTFARFLLFLLIVVFLRFKPQGIFSRALARR